MVFESLVADLLNRFLGDYVENLDSKQLNVGIWGGDVVLRNLDIRPTALDELDLPLKLKSGSLGTLTLKIPWKNLYTEAVLATIEDLYIVATPNLGIKYDEEKEEKQNQETKQRELQRIEEQRKEKRKKPDPAEAAKQDTFAEKLVTQVIKNLQVTIRDIHIRYEDEYTNPKRPFAMGVTLHSLVFQTTDENWKPKIMKEAVKMFFKVVDMDSLSMYWNSGSKLVSQIENRDDRKRAMKEMIASKTTSPKDFNYMLSPISISARLRMNPKPEGDGSNFTVPKIFLTVVVKELGFHVGKYQYQDILEFLEAQERLTLNAKYRKYRPDLRVYKGHEKNWWHFAMNCIMKDQVQRKARNWSWTHMKNHRDLVRKYRDAWIEKRTNTSPAKEIQHTIDEAEKQLDVFNLNIARQQAELYIDRKKLKRVEEQGGVINYLKSWWGGTSQQKNEDEDIAKKFEKAMTSEERAKLYDALDYAENQSPTSYPKEFVENKVSFTLDKLVLVVEDDLPDKKRMEVMIISWQAVSAEFEQRPAGKAIKLDTKMQKFHIEGIKGTDGKRPVIVDTLVVNSEKEKDLPQLLFLFETAPLDGSFDQFVKFHARPLSVVYHAASVNKLAEVFRPPESVRLKQLAAAAFAKYEDIKERSATGLQYALEQRSILKLDIKIMPTIVQIPDKGVMEKSSNVLVIDLGSLQISTLETSKVKADENFYKKSEEEKLKILRKSAYDKFVIELKTLQMLFARPSDNWHEARKQKTSKLHFLQPTGWRILLEKASVEDLRLPKLRVSGDLPDLNVTISDTRLLDILKLLMSIPTPPPAPESAAIIEEEMEIIEPTTRHRAKMKAILEATGDEMKEESVSGSSGKGSEKGEEKEKAVKNKKKQAEEVNHEIIQVELTMVLNQISLNVTQTSDGQAKPYLSLLVSTIKTDFSMRALDMKAVVSLGGLEVQHLFYKTPGLDRPLHLIENPRKSDHVDRPLLSMEYIQVDKKNPHFASKFHMIEQLVQVHGEPLNVVLHQEAMVDLQSFMQTLQKKLDDLKQSSEPSASGGSLEVPKPLDRQTSNMSTASSKSPSAKLRAAKIANKVRSQGPDIDERIITMKLEAFFSGMTVSITNSKRILSDIAIEGLSTEVAMRPKTMEAIVKLQSVGITDPNPSSTYQKILSVHGKEVFSLRYIQHNRTDKEKSKMALTDVDMEVVLSFAEMRFVFLNLWLSQLLAWVAPFQEAAQAAAEQAGAAMQEGARNAAAVIKELQHTTRMKLSVEIQAPVIIVPQSSKSDEALLADFGKLIVGNSFTSTPLRTGGPSSAFFDNMAVQLKEMKLSRVILGGDRWSVVAECQLLEPVSFQLNVNRNLSFGYYKQKPEMVITGNLPLLKVCASREDYGMVMKTLSGNLAESVPQPPPNTTKKSTTGTTVTVTPTTSSTEESRTPREDSKVKTEATIESQPPTASGNGVKMEFSFEIESIAAQLYDGSSNLLAGVAQRDPQIGLAAVEISMISAKGSMLEDGSIDAKVILFSFTMDDSRIDRAGITRLMDKKGGAAAKKQNMIDVFYKKDAQSNQKAELRLRPFFLLVCPEFLGALSRFFIVTKSEEELAIEEHNKAIEQQKEAQESHDDQQKKSSTPEQVPVVPAVGSMEVRMYVEDPEVVLVEDASEPDTTQAVILKFRAELHMESNPETYKLSGGVFGLEITSCHFAIAKRDQNALKVLSPCDIALFANTPQGAGQRYSIEFTPVKIRISPSVIRLLSAVGNNMAAPVEPSAREKQAMIIARQHVWDQKTVVECNFWFLNEVLKAEEAIQHFTPIEELVFDDSKEDQCRLDIEKIELTLEADAGSGTIPMIHLTSGFHADVREWTRRLHAEAMLTLELWYYNEKYNVWEPLIEPVIEDDGTRRPWQLETYVMQQNEYESTDTDVVLQPPKLSIAIVATDNLQMTVTKTLLDLTSELGDGFARAAKNLEPQKKKGIELDYAWSIKNETCEPVEIMDSDAFSPAGDWRGAPLFDFSILQLECNAQRRAIGAEDDKLPLLLTTRFPGLETIRSVDVARAEKRIFGLPKTTHLGDQWHVVVDTTSHFGNKLITIRSPIKIKNHLPINMDLYYRRDGNLEPAGTAEADGLEISPPLHAIYTPSGEIFVQPSDDKYAMGRESIKWREFQRNADWHMLVDCPSADGDQTKDYFVQASIEIEEAYFENTHRKNVKVPCYTIHLSAPTLFRNALPYPLEISAEGVEPQTLTGGESASLCSVIPGKSIILKVNDGRVQWSCQLLIEENFEELTQHTFHGRHPDTNTKMEIDLGLRTTRRTGTEEMTLYCPFWMINKTNLDLAYKNESFVTVFEHAPGSDTPLMFTFSGDAFFAKNKKACLKVLDSSWSEKFPLDIVGSAGRIICKTDGGKEYEVSVNIQLSNSGLTKICTFTPFYLIDNKTNVDVEVRQTATNDKEHWALIPRQECVGFWPEKKSKRMQMAVRYANTKDPERAESQSFPFTESFESLVTMPNEFVGVYVTSTVSDNCVVVSLEQYQDGMAPVLLVNHTENLEVYYRQKDVDEVRGLSAGNCVLFAWTSVMMKRSLLWTCGDEKNVENDLMKDCMGEIDAKKDVKVYWVSFLSGRQRIMLFTQDLAIATTASKPYELERIDQQYTISLQSINISLINNLVGLEIASMAVTSSGIIWEYKKRRFKAFSIKDNKRLEEAYVKYTNEKGEGKKVKSRHTIGNTRKIEVDFEEMKQYKPKEMEIRRSFQSGLWIQYMLSPHEQQLHMKVNHFQIDNQLPVCVFPVLFAPVPPGKSVAAESIPKPFTEVSFIMRKAEHSNMPQIKYFMVLVQEMSVQADKGFINAIIAMFTNNEQITYEREQYEKDMDITHQKLTDLAAITSSTEQKAYYEYLHFSPMKIHLSFSQGGGGATPDDAGKGTPIHSEFLNLLLKSVGVTLTEIQDVQFQLAYMERKAVFMNRQQLTSEAISHYAKQAVKQLYVLVLGLDIIGNPFGLIRDLGTGVETFFYEPIQGIVQGPEEFAEGLALGIRGLFGGVVGGAAGAVSRITGTLGKGLAALTLDDEYQKKRQQMLSRRPANVQEGFAQGAKGLAMGFVEGVTGVFTKPVEGAKKGGVGGFAKGVGTGIVGLVTRPVSGVVDFASSSLQAVKRATDTVDEVKKLRPARFIESDKIIRPFSLRNSEGNQLLQDTAKGKYAISDAYVAHAPVTADKQFFCIVTDQRIMMVSKTLGALEVDWQYRWSELAEAPIMVDKGLKVKLKEPKKKTLGMFGSGSQGKVITFVDRSLGEMIAQQAKEAFERDQ